MRVMVFGLGHVGRALLRAWSRVRPGVRLAAAAKETGTLFLDHAAHLAGIPVTEMMSGVGMEVTRLEGVLNGTTNFILKRLEEGARFEAALEEAIARGFAERDWRYDVQGTDVAIKLVGL